MLIPQGQSKSTNGQGRPPVDLAELRRQLADPSQMHDGARQRLMDLARQLAQLRTLGDEYARVGFSDEARAAMKHPAAVA